MDKVTLTKEQLREAVEYIESRGFRDPLVVAEILDHFACKVEEKLEQDPNLQFTHAMIDAHSEFGIMGFRYIAAATEKQQEHFAKRLFRKKLLKVLTNPSHLLIVLAGGILFYMSYVLCQPYTLWFLEGGEIVEVACVLLFMIEGYLIYKLTPRKYRGKLYTGEYNYLMNGSAGWIWMVCVIMIDAHPPESVSLQKYSLAFTILFSAGLIYYIAKYNSLKAMVDYYKNSVDYIESLNV